MTIRRLCSYRTGRDGFTLIEIMIALTVLAFGLLGVVGLFVTSINGNAEGRKISEASAIAQSRLDRLVNAKPYTMLADDIYPEDPLVKHNFSARGPDKPNGNLPAFYNITTSFVHYTSSITYGNSTSMGGDGIIRVGVLDMYKIRVTCYWVSKGRRHDVTLETIRAEDL